MSVWDDIVVGAGIVGLAHAHALGRRGRRVLVVERGERATGASVRNFGMIWPAGQPEGELHELAMTSRALWLEALQAGGLWHDPVGSLHVSHHPTETAVLEEYAASGVARANGRRMLTPKEALSRCPRLVEEGLEAALWSPTEVCVDPREAVGMLPGYLAQRSGVEFRFKTAVVEAGGGVVRTGGGARLEAERVWICCGAELRGLYPEELEAAGMRRCKLQMMRTTPLGAERIGPMLAAGLTLGHYTSFQGCEALPALVQSLAARHPGYAELGIHVMVSQNGRGELVLGDSHEYDGDIEPFDKGEIDDMVLRYLRGFFELREAAVRERWHGIYVKHPGRAWVELEPDEQTVIVTGLSGAGMTLSFGLGERTVAARLG